MTQTYPTILLDGFLYMVDKKSHKGKWMIFQSKEVQSLNTVDGEMYENYPLYYDEILATTNPSLGLPLILLENDPSRLCPYSGITGYEIWMEGYKAAKGEGRMYSEDDIAKAIKLALSGSWTSGKQAFEFIIKSLYPSIKAIEVECIQSGKCKDDRCLTHPCNGKCYIPKVEKGYIIVKKFIYNEYLSTQ